MKRSEIVDRIGEIDAEVAVLLAEKEKLQARLTNFIGTVEGDAYYATGYEQKIVYFDHTKAKRELGMRKYGACWTTKREPCHRLIVKPLQEGN